GTGNHLRNPQMCHPTHRFVIPSEALFSGAEGPVVVFRGPTHATSFHPRMCHPTHRCVIPSEALFSGAEGPAFRDPHPPQQMGAPSFRFSLRKGGKARTQMNPPHRL